MNLESTNIEIIIDGCVKGKPAAQKRLFEMHYGLVFSVCNRYAATREESKEMLNDSFYTVFKFIDRYDKERPFPPWIRKVTVNCCLQYVRKYFNRPSSVELNDSHFESIEEMSSEADDSYLKLLAKLPPAYKTVINLFVIEEYKHQEIADLLGVSVGTSKSNLHRAKRLLLEMIERDPSSILRFKNNG